MKSIIILSTKSGGSSALQYFLALNKEVKTIRESEHYFLESLFWTKAASILEMPQIKLIGSETPYSSDVARQKLLNLLQSNLKCFNDNKFKDDKDLIFEGWRLLCKEFGPVFLEKSPHHIFQKSALDLIIECMGYHKDINFKILCLKRNPIDTLYSYWKRWKIHPRIMEKQLIIAYKNFIYIKNNIGTKAFEIKYEDLVADKKCIFNITEFCEIESPDSKQFSFHNKSINLWKMDSSFEYSPSNELKSISESLGYNIY